MISVSIRSPAAQNRHRDMFGYGRVYHELVSQLSAMSDVMLVDVDDADIQVCMCLPHFRWEYFPWYGRKRHERQVIYCTWETTKIPYDWVDVLNKCAAVFVTSKWNVETFRSCGVEVPIYSVPHGVDPNKFPMLERNWNSEKFFFLWQGMHPQDRKGRRYAEEAFKKINLKDAVLVEKWYPMISREWGPAVYPNARKIEIGRFLDKSEYIDLLGTCHVSVNPTRGEGFGLLPLETACTGMATIATNWSGMTEYLNDECFRPLKFELCEPGNDYISTTAYSDTKTPPAQDAIPDVDDLAEAMLYFYENRDAAMEMGKRANEYVKNHWTWESAAKKFIEACEIVLS